MNIFLCAYIATPMRNELFLLRGEEKKERANFSPHFDLYSIRGKFFRSKKKSVATIVMKYL